MEKIEEFLNNNFSSGYGHGCGDGCGEGSTDGDGYGDDYSDGSTDGDGDGYCYGDGSGYGIIEVNKRKALAIDGICTILTRVKGNVASGYILNDDLIEERCYVVKGHGYFAHGRTLKEARDALVSKYMESLDEEALFEKFFASFKNDEKYKGHQFFEWHHYLTGSCLMGREAFVKNRGLELDFYFTVKEFFELVRNDYGGEVIRGLEERWNSKYGV